MEPVNNAFSRNHLVKIAHVSDLHFGEADLGVAEALRESLLDFAPDLILVTGDITTSGRTREFRMARAYLDSLPYRKVVVMGNHDILNGIYLPMLVTPLFNPQRTNLRYRRKIPYDSDFRLNGLKIVGLNSTKNFSFARGRIRKDEFARFDSDCVRVLALHHHIIAIPGTGERNMIVNVDDAIEGILKHGINYVFHGHRHRAAHFRLESFMWDRAVNHPIDIFACGTTLSPRVQGDDPYNNYNRVTIDTSPSLRTNRFAYQNVMYEPARKAFLPRDEGFNLLRTPLAPG